MELYVDFHIHTGLSPCGDNDMTPCNIVNMAKLKGLDAIAITDHNSCGNVVSCIDAGKREGILVVPGMELQTREDIHSVCLFESSDKALEFQKIIYGLLPDMQNDERIFGEQLLFDDQDNIIGKCERLLLTSADMSIDDAFQTVSELGGVLIPAHIDRQNFGIINSLGFIPDYLNFKYLEYHSIDMLNIMIKSGIVSSKYSFIHSSDAHYLWDILERETLINIHRADCDEIINYFKY